MSVNTIALYSNKTLLSPEAQIGPVVSLILAAMGENSIDLVCQRHTPDTRVISIFHTDSDCMVNLDRLLRHIAFSHRVELDPGITGEDFYFDSIRRLQESVGVRANVLKDWITIDRHGFGFGPDLIGALCCLDGESSVDFVSVHQNLGSNNTDSAENWLIVNSPTSYICLDSSEILQDVADIFLDINSGDYQAAAENIMASVMEHLIHHSGDVELDVLLQLRKELDDRIEKLKEVV